jgi:DNA modification methylase
MNPLGRNKRSVWWINTEKLKDKYYAAFLEEIVRICFDAGCPESGIVLDPFAGACTTGIAALKSRKRFLGIEVVPRHAELGHKRLLECESIKPSKLD